MTIDPWVLLQSIGLALAVVGGTLLWGPVALLVAGGTLVLLPELLDFSGRVRRRYRVTVARKPAVEAEPMDYRSVRS